MLFRTQQPPFKYTLFWPLHTINIHTFPISVLFPFKSYELNMYLYMIKGLDHFQKENVLTPSLLSSKMFMSFFLQVKRSDFWRQDLSPVHKRFAYQS